MRPAEEDVRFHPDGERRLVFCAMRFEAGGEGVDQFIEKRANFGMGALLRLPVDRAPRLVCCLALCRVGHEDPSSRLVKLSVTGQRVCSIATLYDRARRARRSPPQSRGAAKVTSRWPPESFARIRRALQDRLVIAKFR